MTGPVLQWLLSNALFAGVLAVLVAVVSRWIRWPQMVRALWVLVLLRFVAPPMLPIGSFERVRAWWQDEGDGEVVGLRPVSGDDLVLDAQRVSLVTAADLNALRNAPVEPGADPLLAHQGTSWGDLLTASAASRLAVLLWFAGGAWILVMAHRRSRALRRLLRRAEPCDPPLGQQLTHALRTLGARLVMDLRLLRSRVSPFLSVHRGRPTVAFPEHLARQLSPRQVQLVLAHEVAHFLQRDHWVRRLELLCTALFWWCPVLWWARAHLHQSQESACDSLVMKRYSAHRQDYARALLAVTEFIGPRPDRAIAGMAVVGPRGSLTRRVEMVLSKQGRQGLGLLGRVGVIGMSAAVLPWTAGEVGAQSQDCDEVCVLKEVDAIPAVVGDEDEVKVILRKLEKVLNAVEGDKVKGKLKSSSKDKGKNKTVQRRVVVSGGHGVHELDGNLPIGEGHVIVLGDGDESDVELRSEDGSVQRYSVRIAGDGEGDDRVVHRTIRQVLRGGIHGQVHGIVVDGEGNVMSLDPEDAGDLLLDEGEGGLHVVRLRSHGGAITVDDDGEVYSVELSRDDDGDGDDDDGKAHHHGRVHVIGRGHGAGGSAPHVVHLDEEGLAHGLGLSVGADGEVWSVGDLGDLDVLIEGDEGEDGVKKVRRIQLPHGLGGGHAPGVGSGKAGIHHLKVDDDGNVLSLGDEDGSHIVIDADEFHSDMLDQLKNLKLDGVRTLEIKPGKILQRLGGDKKSDGEDGDDLDDRIERLERELQELKQERAEQRRGRRTTI